MAPGIGTVHLATHALASTSDPHRCAVYLSGEEKLGLDDIGSLPLDSTLVVLSACSTGEGEMIPGEGIIGLGWAFLRAGSDAVGVSLWSVEDDSATELMISFHSALRDGRDPVSALAGARRSMARKRAHPAYWAPFVVIARPAGSPEV
jgi:CHAT domain-containing protein